MKFPNIIRFHDCTGFSFLAVILDMKVNGIWFEKEEKSIWDYKR
jgi:hypothetical protein